ncbi:MAG: hypothetical protein FWD40_11880 [Treponema sp.]|nr:hypothetical protein [Treponema sp.]
MTNIKWPELLPCGLLADSFEKQPQSNVIRTTMDAGPKKARRRYTARTIKHNGKQIFDAAELAVFEQFYHNVIADGVLRFLFKDSITGETAEFRFTDDPVVTDADGQFTVSMSLERL